MTRLLLHSHAAGAAGAGAGGDGAAADGAAADRNGSSSSQG